MTWGFQWGAIRKYLGNCAYYMDGTTWANQNTMNIHVSGENGELSRIARIFPELDWEVSFRDEFGQYGECRHPRFEMDVEGCEEVADVEWAYLNARA